MQTSTPQAIAATTPRDLIPAEAFAGVVATVLDNNKGMEQALAERITEEALKFVAACAKRPGRGLRPSRIVDEGWHALILHTKVYERLCRAQGRFVHHVPERPDPSRHNSFELEHTKASIQKAGLRGRRPAVARADRHVDPCSRRLRAHAAELWLVHGRRPELTRTGEPG